MRAFWRGPVVPDQVRSTVPGRVLAAVQTVDGVWLAGTRDALHARSARDAPVDVPWERIQRADWDLDTSTLTIERLEDYGRPVHPLAFELAEPVMLLELVRERVTASVLLQRRVQLERKRGLSVIARRAPSGLGPVTWAYEFDAGVDPQDPAVSAAAELALAEAQESLGL
jgi:hypothetical protein